ncbi:hypothetical protein BDV25DRAFT_138021 [Aspergillus avenaceus]|uniref:Uncharacterized protein n=1 Tax=Aspergillus avenaceus TaxID=36643 RepID=A0A5N6U171_ASPAV|nr:hypothetical protein BDV25DRAFT_138021 [Aspergillus avenaceus]
MRAAVFFGIGEFLLQILQALQDISIAYPVAAVVDGDDYFYGISLHSTVTGRAQAYGSFPARERQVQGRALEHPAAVEAVFADIKLRGETRRAIPGFPILPITCEIARGDTSPGEIGSWSRSSAMKRELPLDIARTAAGRIDHSHQASEEALCHLSMER